MVSQWQPWSISRLYHQWQGTWTNDNGSFKILSNFGKWQSNCNGASTILQSIASHSVLKELALKGITNTNQIWVGEQCQDSFRYNGPKPSTSLQLIYETFFRREGQTETSMCFNTITTLRSCKDDGYRELVYEFRCRLLLKQHDDVIKWKQFRVTVLLCGEFTSHRWIPRTRASDAELWCFLPICAWTNSWAKNEDAGDLIRHRAHSPSLWRHRNEMKWSTDGWFRVQMIKKAFSMHRKRSNKTTQY